MHGNGTTGGQKDVGLVDNLQSNVYWSGTAFAPYPTNDAWSFYTYFGGQSYSDQPNLFFAWAACPGDVAGAQPNPVPEPMSAALLGLGLAGMALARRRRVLGAS